MSIIATIKDKIANAIDNLYQQKIAIHEIQINETKQEFNGDYTLVTFPLTKILRKKPDEIASELGAYLIKNDSLFVAYEVIKGFLNVTISPNYYFDFLKNNYLNQNLGFAAPNQKKVMIEYSSPNTNKPLHFGHLRNIFLGHSVAAIMKQAGYEIIKANLINDRGIHICKSMIAWQLFANGETPKEANMKGDHFVGRYYVMYNDEFKKQVNQLIEEGRSEEDAAKNAPIFIQAQQLLRQWEAGDQETILLWKRMNEWVYEGFYATYEKMGITFDKFYYESNTYLLGRDFVMKALANGVLFEKEDKSIWIDLQDEGLDQKLLLRGDGTSVYITQDIGTAVLKYNDYKMDTSVYVIGDEQNYHMQVLKLILQKMKEPCADGIYHLSYGMVELPSGRMKSREGTVVDADDMIDEMKAIAQKNTEELGKVQNFSEPQLAELYTQLGLGALKFYLLRVDPKKKMMFNPQESIDFHGFTGPFIQYGHTRICSILKKATIQNFEINQAIEMSLAEKNILKLVEQYPTVVEQAATEMNPSLIGNYVYQLVKQFNSFLVDHSILKAEQEDIMKFRLQLCMICKHIISNSLFLLGIDAPEQM
ncbi:MAG TPA: arginine--tRNA ligase [Chitinophagaceae bacterium]|nr:arginine--tRNA ligase [Chitinophagaceae bacterium]